MVKVYGQNIPAELYDGYTRIFGVQRSTGWNYWTQYYGYGYGGLVGSRIPFRMRRWQNKFGKKISEKRLTQRSKFQKAVWIWWNQLYSYGASWQHVGPKPRTLWASTAHQTGWQYFQFFMYYSLPGLIQGKILDWQKLGTFQTYVFDDSVFG